MKTRFTILCICAVALISAVSYLSAADGVVIGNGTSFDPASHAPTALDASDNGTTNADNSMNKRLLVAGKSIQITPNFAVSTSAYSGSYVVGGKLTLSNAMRISGGNGRLQSVLLVESSSTLQKSAMELVIFDTPTLTGTFTDRTAFAPSASDLTHIIRRVPIAASDYITVSGTTVAVADVGLTERILQASGTNALGAVLVTATTGTPTYSATNSLILRLGIKQD